MQLLARPLRSSSSGAARVGSAQVPAAGSRRAVMASLLRRRAAAASRLLLLPPPPPGPAGARRGSWALPAALVRRGALVGGRWVETPSAFPVRDPASGDELGRVADCGEAEARAAVRAAHEAGAAWGRLPAKVSGGERWRRRGTGRPGGAGRSGGPQPGGGTTVMCVRTIAGFCPCRRGARLFADGTS